MSNRSKQTFDELQELFKHAHEKHHPSPTRSPQNQSGPIKASDKPRFGKPVYLRVHSDDPRELDFEKEDLAMQFYLEMLHERSLLDHDESSLMSDDRLEDYHTLPLEERWATEDILDLSFDRIVDIQELEKESILDENFDLDMEQLSTKK